MENAVSSGFQFRGFFIEETHIVILGNTFENLELNIQPEGIHYKKDNKFHLKLSISVSDKSRAFDCMLRCRGEFTFNKDGDIIPDFFYQNAPAIVFPYIRAYISTLTNLSTAGYPITLPTLKMDFREQLKGNIQVEE